MSVSGEVSIEGVTYFHPVHVDGAADAHRAAFAFNETQAGISASAHTLTAPETTEFLKNMEGVEEPSFDASLGCYVAPIPDETLSELENGLTTGEFVIQRLVFRSDGVNTPQRPVNGVLADFNAELAEVTARTAIANGSSTNSPIVCPRVRVKGDDDRSKWVGVNFVDAGSSAFTGVERSASRLSGYLNGLVGQYRERAYRPAGSNTPDTSVVEPLATCYRYTQAS